MKRVFLIFTLIVLLSAACIEIEDIPRILWTATVPAGTEVATIDASSTEAVATSKPATSTPEPTATFTTTPSSTPAKTATMTATSTATLIPTNTPVPTAVPLRLQEGVPIYIQNFGYPDAGCNWLGVAGQVFDKNGDAILNLVVWVRGMLNGEPFEAIALTGTAEGDIYGPGGYEIVLHDTPIETKDVFSIQILDLDGNILSDQVYFETHQRCEENLIIINFSE